MSEQIETFRTHLPRYVADNLQRAVATTPHDHASSRELTPPSLLPRASINPPATGAGRCVRSRSLVFHSYAPSRGHARFIYSFPRAPSSYQPSLSLSRKLAAGDSFTLPTRRRVWCAMTTRLKRSVGARVRARRGIAQAGSKRSGRPRRTGDAPALRVYRGLKACVSPGGLDGPRHGGGTG